MGTPSPTYVLHYIIPTSLIIVTCISPIALLLSIGGSQAAKGALSKPLSALSWLIIVLSCPFFLSSLDDERTALSTYAVYCVLLALANMVADNTEKKRVWVALSIWHALNLLNLIGGKFSILQLYSAGNKGLIVDVYSIPKVDADCAGGDTGTYCDNTLVTTQMILALFYIVLHVIAFFIVVGRAAQHYGGEYAPEDSENGRGSMGMSLQNNAAMEPTNMPQTG